jgi:hypothetical protein
MKRAVCFLSVGLLLVACGSSNLSSNSGPNVTVHLAQVNMAPDIFYFSGPVNVQYQLSITNPTSEPLTLSRLDLETTGPGAYSLRSQATPMNLKVPPNSTATYTISVWGRTRGGYLTADEPVTLRGTAYFKGTSGSFARIFTENIFPR